LSRSLDELDDGTHLRLDRPHALHEDGRLYDISHDQFEKNDLQQSDKPEILAAKKKLQAVLDQNK